MSEWNPVSEWNPSCRPDGEEPERFYMYLVQLTLQTSDGETREEPYDGEGEARFVGGHVYQGMFSGGLMNGYGVFTHAHGIIYEGEFVRNLPMGKGTFTWPDGSSYEGDICNGIRSGTGTFRCANSPVCYTGQWHNAKRHGKGTVFYNQEKSSWFRGDWVYNTIEGWGERRYPSGNTYYGEWKNNQRHGQGTMKWPGIRQEYTGHWQNGVQHGQGTHVWILGTVDGSQYTQNNQYIGEFANGLRDGVGTFLYAGGVKFEGDWKENRKHGKGKFTFRNGLVLEGRLAYDRVVMSDQDVRNNAPPDAILKSASNMDIWMNVVNLLKIVPEQDRASERQQVEFVVLREIENLRSILSFYSKLGDACYTRFTVPMCQMQMWRLLKDCNVHLHGFTLTQLNRFIQERSSLDGSPFTKVLLGSLLDSLMIVAYHIYSKEIPSQRQLLSFCLSKLMMENILPHAKKVKGFLYQQPAVAAAALKYAEKCWEVYQAHCRIYAAAKDKRIMTYRQLMWLLKDFDLLDERLTAGRVVEIMTAESSDPTNLIHSLHLEINFLEFFEVLLACAEVKRLPDPSSPDPSAVRSPTPPTEDPSAADAQSQDVTTDENEAQRSEGLAPFTEVSEADDGESKEVTGGVESEGDTVERRIQAVDHFFNLFISVFELNYKLLIKLKEMKIQQQAQRKIDVVTALTEY